MKNPPQGISKESAVLIASASTFDPSIGSLALKVFGLVGSCADGA